MNKIAKAFPREIQCSIRVDTDELLARIDLPIEVDAFGYTFVVPAGTETDFASVPRCLWGIVPPFGKHSIAAIVHDYAYRTGFCTRWEADALFRSLMQRAGVGALRRWIIWAAVRCFGWMFYTGDE